jgi:hypothetical protein
LDATWHLCKRPATPTSSSNVGPNVV